MKLVNLARSESDSKEAEKAVEKSPSPFGYGTRIRLEKEDLKKLGIKLADISVGDTFDLQAEAEVCSVNQSPSADYDSSSLELQITSLGLEQDDTLAGAIDDAIEEADEE